ncbi:MAG: ZIP family metal transporter [bacterium]
MIWINLKNVSYGPEFSILRSLVHMEQNVWIAIAASLIAAAVTTSGIVVIRRHEAWARQNTTYFACFAAGVLIAVSFLHIVPTSIAMSPQAPAYLFAGYMVMHVFNRFLTAYVCDKPETAEYALGLIPLIGIGFHSFLDGVVYSISFSVSLLTGALVALGMVLHEFPEGIVTYTLLVRSGLSGRQSFVLAFLAAALTTPVGLLSVHQPDRRSAARGSARAFGGRADLCRRDPSVAACGNGAATVQPGCARGRRCGRPRHRAEQGMTACVEDEPRSAPLRRQLAEALEVPERLIHINAGSELIPAGRTSLVSSSRYTC